MDFRKFIFIIYATFFVVQVDGVKILSIFNMPSPSHYIYGSALLKELAARGHDVTSVTVYPQKSPIKNFHDVFIETNTRIFHDFIDECQDGEEQSTWNMYSKFLRIGIKMCKNLYAHHEFRKLLTSKDVQFDLIIIEAVFTDSLSGLGEHFNAPMIAVSSFGTMIGVDDIVGNVSPNSIIPGPNLNFDSRMTFWERIQNFMCNMQFYYLYKFRTYNLQKALYHENFPNASLTFDEARINFSLLILNQHHSLSYPRPYVPNAIEAAGLHIKHNPDPLPEDIQKFLDSSTEGVVYFSMGSNLQSKDLPLQKRNIFLNVFRKLKQKVLWKFEDTDLPNKPDNVLIKPWIPQHSVLHHPNVKVFMTHGGLLSTTEALFYGKPILGIPMFGDQIRNILFAKNRGTGLSVNFPQLTEQELEESLSELLYNPKYKNQVRKISNMFHDTPMTPMETAIYWIEYVLRHNGADHLRNVGVYLNLWQYYSVDVAGFLLISLISVILTVIWLVKVLIRYFHSAPISYAKKLKKH